MARAPALLFLGILLFFVFLAADAGAVPATNDRRPARRSGRPRRPRGWPRATCASGRAGLRFASAITGYDARDVAAGLRPTTPPGGGRPHISCARAPGCRTGPACCRRSRAWTSCAAGSISPSTGTATRSTTPRATAGPISRLGVTLALRADAEQNAELKRSLELQAIAHFAEVRPRDPVHAPALYDRAILLEDVGRHDEALELSRQYLAHDPASVWSRAARRGRTALIRGRSAQRAGAARDAATPMLTSRPKS